MILDLRFCRFLKSNCCGNDKKLKKIERKHVLDQESKIQEKNDDDWGKKKEGNGKRNV